MAADLALRGNAYIEQNKGTLGTSLIPSEPIPYILVVDDDRHANALVQFVLSNEEFEVACADNPRGAMQMIRKREPDLIFLDVGMPDINGFEFTAQLRTEGYNIPIIFLTAADNVEDRVRGLRLGAEDYICKPFNHLELALRTHAVMRRIKNKFS